VSCGQAGWSGTNDGDPFGARAWYCFDFFAPIR